MDTRVHRWATQVGKIDLQGPMSARILLKVLQEPEQVLGDLAYFSFTGHFDPESELAQVRLCNGTRIMLSRTGYTGEFGFEIFADSKVALPPLNEYLCRELIRSTRASRFLSRFRDLPPADIDQLTNVLQRISEIACELPEIRELDINPLLVHSKGNGATAADCRIILKKPEGETGE